MTSSNRSVREEGDAIRRRVSPSPPERSGSSAPVNGEGLDVFRPGLLGLGTPAKATAHHGHDDDDVLVPRFSLSTTPSNVKAQKKRMKACTEHTQRETVGTFARHQPSFFWGRLYARTLPAAAAEVVAVGNVSSAVEVRGCVGCARRRKKCRL